MNKQSGRSKLWQNLPNLCIHLLLNMRLIIHQLLEENAV